MSRSFIAIKTVTYSGKQYIAELDSGDTAIDVEVHNGTFMLNKRDFESIKTISEFFKKVYDWFYESMEDPACTIDEVDEALNIYGSGNFTEIRSSQKEDVHFIAVFSRIEYWDEPYGASLIVYDFESKSLVEEHRDEFPYSDMEDCYGDDLYEQFLSESFNSVPPRYRKQRKF